MRGRTLIAEVTGRSNEESSHPCVRDHTGGLGRERRQSVVLAVEYWYLMRRNTQI